MSSDFIYNHFIIMFGTRFYVFTKREDIRFRFISLCIELLLHISRRNLENAIICLCKSFVGVIISLVCEIQI